MGDKELKQLAQNSIEAFNRADWDMWRKLHAPNVVYEEFGTSRRMTGHDEVIASFRGWREAFPDIKGRVNNVIVSGNQAVLEVEWSGTHRGTLKTPFGTIPPSGRSNTTKAMLCLTMEKDRIVSNRHYFDFYSILRQVGALPEKLMKAAGA